MTWRRLLRWRKARSTNTEWRRWLLRSLMHRKRIGDVLRLWWWRTAGIHRPRPTPSKPGRETCPCVRRWPISQCRATKTQSTRATRAWRIRPADSAKETARSPHAEAAEHCTTTAAHWHRLAWRWSTALAW